MARSSLALFLDAFTLSSCPGPPMLTSSSPTCPVQHSDSRWVGPWHLIPSSYIRANRQNRLAVADQTSQLGLPSGTRDRSRRNTASAGHARPGNRGNEITIPLRPRMPSSWTPPLLALSLARDNIKIQRMIFQCREAFPNIDGDPHLGEPRGTQRYRLPRRPTTRNHPLLAWIGGTEADSCVPLPAFGSAAPIPRRPFHSAMRASTPGHPSSLARTCPVSS